MREIDVPMPKLSMTMEEGELITWRKQEGDQVRAGEVICEVNSDKVAMEVESPADGTLVRYAATEGDIVPVGAPIATLATEAEDLLGGLLGPAGPDGSSAPATPLEPPASMAEPAGPPDTTGAPARAAAGPKPVVPAARRRASELGVDLAAVTGTGRDGLVRVADVDAAAGDRGAPAAASAARAPAAAASVPAAAATAAPAAVAGDVDEVPLTSMRRAVARRLVESMQQAPHFYLTVRVDAEQLMGLREELNRQLQAAGEDVKVSINDLVVKACALMLRANPDLNMSWGGDKLLRHHGVHVGMAVAVEGGLIVPVVRDADQKSVTQIAREARVLIGRARAGKLAPQDFSGGTFTVSNLGMFGIDQFTAVINPPEAAILAVGAAVPEPVAVAGGGVEVHPTMRLTLSIDHRALDGATGAGFLAQVRDLLQGPLRILA
jgi:pyruvate dehydrogenase E2 component (dihydrolipoyllysine-residue acetyltransferase)